MEWIDAKRVTATAPPRMSTGHIGIDESFCRMRAWRQARARDTSTAPAAAAAFISAFSSTNWKLSNARPPILSSSVCIISHGPGMGTTGKSRQQRLTKHSRCAWKRAVANADENDREGRRARRLHDCEGARQPGMGERARETKLSILAGRRIIKHSRPPSPPRAPPTPGRPP